MTNEAKSVLIEAYAFVAISIVAVLFFFLAFGFHISDAFPLAFWGVPLGLAGMAWARPGWWRGNLIVLNEEHKAIREGRVVLVNDVRKAR